MLSRVFLTKKNLLNVIDDYIDRNNLNLYNDITDALHLNDIDLAIYKFNDFASELHKVSRMRKERVVNTNNNLIIMNEANDKFDDYLECLKNGSMTEITQSLNDYQSARKAVTRSILQEENAKWRNALSNKNSKQLWSTIDWKGHMNNKIKIHPTLNELKAHFEHIYSTDDLLESTKIEELKSEVYIPVLDDPIDRKEIIEAMNACKKGGYDISLPVLDKVISKCLPIFVLLFNFIFYVAYPVKLACSLLFPIPKKGSLKKSSNFRGIQMLPTIGALYDRVITRRLDRWLCIHDEQTGQKGKSTLTQLFTLRIIVEMIKKTGETLYIGCFDIEKAYDKVSRFLLLQKLIKYGIGFAMLNALKAMYTVTT